MFLDHPKRPKDVDRGLWGNGPARRLHSERHRWQAGPQAQQPSDNWAGTNTPESPEKFLIWKAKPQSKQKSSLKQTDFRKRKFYNSLMSSHKRKYYIYETKTGGYKTGREQEKALQNKMKSPTERLEDNIENVSQRENGNPKRARVLNQKVR